jgi:hypothetical protein
MLTFLSIQFFVIFMWLKLHTEKVPIENSTRTRLEANFFQYPKSSMAPAISYESIEYSIPKQKCT